MRGREDNPVDTKRGELSLCDEALITARRRLDDAAQRTRAYPADRELDDLQPLSLEIARLRTRRDRIEQELAALEAEWSPA